MKQNFEASEDKNSLKNKTKKQKKLVDMEGVVTHNLSNGNFLLKL